MPKPKTAYIRAYPHSLAGANWGKVERVLDLFTHYIVLAAVLRDQQMKLFFTAGRLDKNAPIRATTALSARYQQTCQYQVVAMLQSWLAQREDDFRRLVLRSSLDGALRDELLAINRRQAWHRDDLGFSAEALRLARHLMRHLRSVHRLPDTRHINLALDAKVAKLERARTKGAFPWWLKLSTLEAGRPVWLPVEGNPRFDASGGTLKPFVQVNLSEKGLSAAFLKEFRQKPCTPQTAVLALDSGLSVLFATDQGDLLGNGIFARLQALDSQVAACAKGRQERGLRVRSARYDALVARVRGLLQCEIGRILNTLVERLKPAEIVMEALDFRDGRLSKRMNRLIRNFGRRVVKDKLAALGEEYGIVVTEIPAAYTSQACPNCHHVEKGNRKTRDTFCCQHCGYHRHADVTGARNIRSRRSWPEAKAGLGLWMRREAVLSRVRDAHQLWRAHHHAVRRKRSWHSAAPPPSESRSPARDTGPRRSSEVAVR